MDHLTLIGLLLGVGAILGGQYLEGGSAATLLNGPAFLIVVGGTLGATMLQSSIPTFMRSLRHVRFAIAPPRFELADYIDKIVVWSNIARKEGLLGLENAYEAETNPFARKALMLLVDGREPEVVRNILELEVDNREHHDLQAARVFESMGGYSPTIGIIGAVMGLIQVMNNLSEPSMLGHGIAVAFVATIYGIGFANLLLIPLANKLKSVSHSHSQFQYMLVEGIVSIAGGENPRNIETKLHGYLH